MPFNRDAYYTLRNRAKMCAHRNTHKVISQDIGDVNVQFTSYEDGGISWTVHFIASGLRFDNYGTDGTEGCTRLLEQAGLIWYM